MNRRRKNTPHSSSAAADRQAERTPDTRRLARDRQESLRGHGEPAMPAPRGLPAIADRDEEAPSHWLRRTAGAHMASNAVDLRRDNSGHESISTTSQYLHAYDDARHRETETLHKMGW